MPSRFHAVRMQSPEEFRSLIEHTTCEAYRARSHWEVLVAMDGAVDEYAMEFNLTPAFWEKTRYAHQDDLQLRLGRLYDPHPTGTGLGNLLQTLKENVTHTGTVFPAAITSLSVPELEADMVSVSNHDAVVAKLLTVRNEYIAHRGTRHVQKGTFTTLPSLEHHEIAELVYKAIVLLTKYRRHFSYPIIAWGEYEVDDLQRLLALVRVGQAT